MWLEGDCFSPLRDDGDLARFEAEIRMARRAGASIVRTVMLSGRRYETFASLSAFRQFGERALHSLNLAAPVVVRHGVRLAVENHKDWRADELLAILKRPEPSGPRGGLPRHGATAWAVLLEDDPIEVVGRRWPPSHSTTHFKDIRVSRRVPTVSSCPRSRWGRACSTCPASSEH